jgi:hypothetical protein
MIDNPTIMTSENPNFFLDLPLVVSDLILNFVTIADLISLCQVSKATQLRIRQYIGHTLSKTEKSKKFESLLKFLDNNDHLLPLELRAKQQRDSLARSPFGLFCVEHIEVPDKFFNRFSLVYTVLDDITVHGHHVKLYDPFVGRLTLAPRCNTFYISRQLGRIPSGVFNVLVRLHLDAIQRCADNESIRFSLWIHRLTTFGFVR